MARPLFNSHIYANQEEIKATSLPDTIGLSEVISAVSMPLHQICVGGISSESMSNTRHENDGGHEISQPPENKCTTISEDTAPRCLFTAAFTHIASMTESLDDLLAGEIEPPTIHEIPRNDNSFAVQTHSILLGYDELDPTIVEDGQIDYERYLVDVREKSTNTPRIERVNEPDYFISRGVVTGTSYPIRNKSLVTQRNQARNNHLQNLVPDFNSDTTLWETREERINAISHQHSILGPEARLSEYFVWGLSYNPPDQLSQGYRTVHFDIPIGTSLKKALNNIKTGAIYSATICNTIKITGCLTALVVFVEESGAMAMTSNMTDKAQNLIHITTHPTWPIDRIMIQRIKQGWTRCLSIRGLPSTFSADNVFDMIVQPRYGREKEVLEVHHDGQGDFRVEFSSITAADQVYRSIYTHCKYPNVVVGFEADPCSTHQPVPFAATPDCSPVTITPPSSFGSPVKEIAQGDLGISSSIVKYGPPPPFLLPIRSVSATTDFSGDSKQFGFIDNRGKAYESTNEVDDDQYGAAELLMQIHKDDALIAAQRPKEHIEVEMDLSELAVQLPKAEPEVRLDFSEFNPTFEYHGSRSNWADEMIDEEERKSALVIYD